MQMPGRKYEPLTPYRYGFNGKEMDKENPVQYDYGFRIYDPRLARFKSLDPLQKKYPALTPYQFGSNRPMDGIDVDGKEYITYHVTIVQGADGNPVFHKTIAKDYRGMSSVQMAIIHRNVDYVKNFYKYYSESFGPEGRGFKWVYFNEKGDQIDEPVWQMRQSKSLYWNEEFSGYYSGTGSVTKFGPGPLRGGYDYLNNDYDFDYKPMGYSDFISKKHDKMQEEEILQPQGWLEDVRTLKSDNILLTEADAVTLFNDPTNSREDWLRTKAISTFFSAVIRYKEWKIREMIRDKYNPNSASDQLKVIFSDWHPKFLSKDWFAKRLLSLSPGPAKENERNTIRPVPKKSPIK